MLKPMAKPAAELLFQSTEVDGFPLAPWPPRYALDYGIRRSNLGGRDATALLALLLLGRGRSFTSSSGKPWKG